MTRDQFRKALQKGQGRAILHLLQNDPAPYLDEILYACLHNTTYDQECEGTREDYLFEAINLSGRLDFLKSEVFEKLLTSTDNRDASQLVELARLFAERGDSNAREAIYKRFDNGCEHEKYPIGSYSIVELDRLDGLLHVMEQNGKRMLRDPDFEPTVYGNKHEVTGLTILEVRHAIRMASKQSQNIQACRAKIASEQRTYRTHRVDRRSPKDFTLPEIKSVIDDAANKPNGISLFYLFRSWAHHATENDLRLAALGFPRELDSDRIKRYLYMFSGRSLSEMIDRLLELTRDDDTEIERLACLALKKRKDVRVRELALQRIADGKLNGSTLSLLKHNYQQGDGKTIQDALPADPDDHLAHDIGMGLRDIFEEYPERDCVQLSFWLVDHTPCAMCRFAAIKTLVESGSAPQSLIEEARHDCYSDTRALVSTAQQQE
ncbi:MAG: hypothetical protein AABZ08_06775 [Planctomycetota bacterium]